MPGALVRFIARRILHTLALVFVATSLALVFVHLAGSGALDFEHDPSSMAAERARLGLDRPLGEQYVRWMKGAARLDFGESVIFHRPVASLLAERLDDTLLLGLAALALALGFGLPAGVISASAPRSPAGRVIRALSLLLVSIPPIVTSLILLLVAVRSGALGAAGLLPPSETDGAAWVLETLRRLPLPALALALPTAAALERVQSRAMETALRTPAVTAARARGVSAARATWVHAWRLSLPPVLGILGVVLGSILSGSLVVEIVMSRPGLGVLMHSALMGRDLALATACAATAALFLAIGVTASEVALAFSDPRKRDAL